MMLVPRTLASLAIPKPKISLQFLFRRGVWGEPAKNGKENFWFWFRRFIPEVKDLYLYFSIVAIFCPSFPPSFASVRGAPRIRVLW